MKSDKPALKVFISYKWEDEDHNKWVEKFATDLRNVGIEAILDRWEVRLGDSFTNYMTSKINEADVVLFVITPASADAVEAPKGKGGAVKFEMQMATARRTAGQRIRLIGIYREGDKTPLYLRDHRYADFRNDSKYKQNLKELAADLLDEISVPPVADTIVPSLIGNEQVKIELPGTKTGADGAEMVLIPAGEFRMGSNDAHASENPVHTVYLDAFYMDIYQVMNAQYKEFTETTGYKAPRYWDDLGFNAFDHPVVGVTWHDAVAYAKWAEKRLPTEAEWEKAARGGLVGMEYPWDGGITKENANYGSNVGYTTSVGSYAPNGYGLYDMAGNVWEWCADWYGKDYYSSSPDSNPAGPDSGTFRVLRGGSWGSFRNDLRVAYRLGNFPTNTRSVVGFRCVSQD